MRKTALLTLGVCCASLIIPSTQAQFIIADDFDVTGGSSTETGFGTNTGINTEIAERLQGLAVTPGMQYIHTAPGKAGSAFSITGNRLQVADVTGASSFQLSADGVNAFNFGSFLAGTNYEINLTMDLDDLEATARRMTFFIADAPTPAGGIGNADLGFQLATGGTSGGPMSVFRRIDSASNSTGVDINSSVTSGLPFGVPVVFTLRISDSTVYTGFDSTYDLLVNGASVSTGSFRFNDDDRYLVFDVAPDAGPAAYENFSVVPEPATSILMMGGLGLLGFHRRRR